MAAKSAKNREYDPVRQQKDMLMEDLKRMREDPGSLGMSEAERTKMIGDATSAANAQQQGQVSQLGQQALAGQGFQAGAFQEAQRGIAGQSGDAAVKAAVGVNDLNQRMIQQAIKRARHLALIPYTAD